MNTMNEKLRIRAEELSKEWKIDFTDAYLCVLNGAKLALEENKKSSLLSSALKVGAILFSAALIVAVLL
jgi:hypothetical protein